MSISLPKPNIEPAPGEPLDEKRLRGALKDIQRSLEVIRGVVPLGPQDLNDDAKELFLQLVASLLGAKVNVGEDTWTWPGATTVSTARETNHGLGVTPVFFGAFGTNNGEFGAFGFSQGATSSVISTSGIATTGTPSAGKTMKFRWIAIG